MLAERRQAMNIKLILTAELISHHQKGIHNSCIIDFTLSK